MLVCNCNSEPRLAWNTISELSQRFLARIPCWLWLRKKGILARNPSERFLNFHHSLRDSSIVTSHLESAEIFKHCSEDVEGGVLRHNEWNELIVPYTDSCSRPC